ncbi:sulfatase [Tamlana crocina]
MSLKYRLIITLFTLVGLVSCEKEETVKKPNIIYVCADQWRASSVGFGGDKTVKTPNIDKLADAGLNFTNCVSVDPVCTPYRAALMTGKYPTSTGMFLNDLYLPSDELCMGEIYQQAGYNTAYIGKWHLDGHGRKGYIPPERRQGWEYWKGAECDHHNPRSHYYTGNSNEIQYWEGFDVFAQTADAQNYIQEHAKDDNPFVLMLSYGPPHPASPPAPKEYRDMYPLGDIELLPNVPEEYHDEARAALQNYYALGSAVDSSVGELIQTIKAAGIEDNTILVFTSDHGGMIRSHSLPVVWKQVHWDESARVPFLMYYPGLKEHTSRQVKTPINTPDILPTLLGLSGISIPKTIEGEDVSAMLKEGSEIEGRSSLYMSVAPIVGQGDAYRAIRTDRYSYTRLVDGTRLLFDIIDDPYEMNNLIGNIEFEDISNTLEKKLQEHLEKIGDTFEAPAHYIEKWGYVLGDKDEIPYKGETIVQSPKPIN